MDYCYDYILAFKQGFRVYNVIRAVIRGIIQQYIQTWNIGNAGESYIQLTVDKTGAVKVYANSF
jgi:hypothetical protein